jgi:hypothetical protein
VEREEGCGGVLTVCGEGEVEWGFWSLRGALFETRITERAFMNSK